MNPAAGVAGSPAARDGARRLRTAGSFLRAGWGVADQACSSLTNFLVGMLVARYLGPAQLGAFALAFASYGIALSASGALASQPLLVRFSGTSEPTLRRASAWACGTALTLGGVAGLACLIVAYASSGPISQAYLALGLSMPGLLLQDSWRMAFFASRRGRDAFMNDAIWAVALVPAFAVTLGADRPSLFSVTLAWGLGANVAAIAGLLQARLLPSPRHTRAWLTQHRDLGPRFLAESVLLSGTMQVVVTGIAAVAGLTAVAGIRGAQILLGPPYVVSTGLKLVLLPRAVEALRGSVGSVRRLCTAQSLSMSGAMVAWGLMLLLIPSRWGTWLLGRTWEPVHEVLVPVTLAYAAGAAIIGASTGLRAFAAAKRSLRSRLVASVLQVSGGLAGAVLAGGVGAAWGLATAGAMSVLIFWRSLLGCFGEHEPRAAAQAAGTAPVVNWP
jgi:O-antigen/teichoic acid export membrane protein